MNTSVKTAVILAAGKGTRLDKITKGEYPKPLTPVEGIPIVERSILALKAFGVKRILLGCGHMIEAFYYLVEKYEEVDVVENKKYAEFGSIYTFLVFEELVSEPFFLLEADILFDPRMISFLVEKMEKSNAILTSNPVPLDDNVFYYSKNEVLEKLTKEEPKQEPEGVMTGIWMLSGGFLKRFATFCEEEKVSFGEDYEHILAHYSQKNEPIEIVHSAELSWCEIDTEEHLEYARNTVWPKIRNG